MLYLLIFYFLFFSYLAYKKTDWAIYLIVAALPGYLIRFSIFGLPTTLLEMMILILFAVWLIKGNFSWARIKNNPFSWPIVAILIFSVISIFTSPNLIKALGVWRAYFFEPLIFFFILTGRIKNPKQLYNIFWALGVSVFYLSAIAIWQKFSGWNVPLAFLNPDGSVDRVVSVFGYPNALGLYLGPIMILFTGFLRQKTKSSWPRIIKFLIILLGLITILLAQSEAAIFTVVLIWFIWGMLYKKTRLYFFLILLAGVIIFFSNPLINYFIIEKFTLQDYSGFIRRLIWGETWQMLKHNWLFGAGLAGYQTAIAKYHLPTFEIFLYPHNIFLNFWSELGLMGLISFLWLIISFIGKNLKSMFTKVKSATGDFNIPINITLTFTIFEIIIHGLVDAPYFKNDLSILFWLIIGIFVINKNIKAGQKN